MIWSLGTVLYTIDGVFIDRITSRYVFPWFLSSYIVSFRSFVLLALTLCELTDVDFTNTNKFKDSEKWPSGHVLNRYSIRYMPEEAKVFEADWNEGTTGRGGKPLSAFEDAYPAV
jgi:hypothetical protein